MRRFLIFAVLILLVGVIAFSIYSEDFQPLDSILRVFGPLLRLL
jgi:hypothetical protein